MIPMGVWFFLSFCVAMSSSGAVSLKDFLSEYSYTNLCSYESMSSVVQPMIDHVSASLTRKTDDLECTNLVLRVWGIRRMLDKMLPHVEAKYFEEGHAEGSEEVDASSMICFLNIMRCLDAPQSEAYALLFWQELRKLWTAKNDVSMKIAATDLWHICSEWRGSLLDFLNANESKSITVEFRKARRLTGYLFEMMNTITDMTHSFGANFKYIFKNSDPEESKATLKMLENIMDEGAKKLSILLDFGHPGNVEAITGLWNCVVAIRCLASLFRASNESSPRLWVENFSEEGVGSPWFEKKTKARAKLEDLNYVFFRCLPPECQSKSAIIKDLDLVRSRVSLFRPKIYKALTQMSDEALVAELMSGQGRPFLKVCDDLFKGGIDKLLSGLAQMIPHRLAKSPITWKEEGLSLDEPRAEPSRDKIDYVQGKNEALEFRRKAAPLESVSSDLKGMPKNPEKNAWGQLQKYDFSKASQEERLAFAVTLGAMLQNLEEQSQAGQTLRTELEKPFAFKRALKSLKNNDQERGQKVEELRKSNALWSQKDPKDNVLAAWAAVSSKELS